MKDRLLLLRRALERALDQTKECLTNGTTTYPSTGYPRHDAALEDRLGEVQCAVTSLTDAKDLDGVRINGCAVLRLYELGIGKPQGISTETAVDDLL